MTEKSKESKKVNIFAKYGVDTNKEKNGVPFYIDKEADCYIVVARWSNRNTDLAKENADLTAKIAHLSEDEQEQERVKLFVKHLVKDWNNVYGADDEPIPFSVENAIKVLQLTPDLVNELVGFALDRTNYPIDNFDNILKN